ncbi:MAG: hypothetical protein LBN39_10860 [Planctomycetaceae bacterium]|jgi:hypothetical protein|nr:hypothetical protein [Planctomycetaceae bacterium]
MRLTSFGIVLVLAAGFFTARTHAQIPERVLFQPGSYAYGSYGKTEAAPAAAVAEDAPKTEWEEKFGGEEITDVAGEASTAEHKPVPYLAYHRSPWTGRTHVIPYEPGYANSPDEFPKQQSALNRWLDQLPCRTQDRPQVKYAGYYDPDPVIVADKPSRCQLILGYPNAGWTTCCGNQWGTRMAQCPGIELVPLGPYAEIGVKDQPCVEPLPGPFGGIFNGVRPFDYGYGAAPVRQGFTGFLPNREAASAVPCPCEENPGLAVAGAPRVAPRPAPYHGVICPEKKVNSAGCDVE